MAEETLSIEDSKNLRKLLETEKDKLFNSEEYLDFNKLRYFIIHKEERDDFLLFRIGNNLKKIADSLEKIAIKG
jgi:hypothetical protein